jgi:nucleotide-binding universal stress UspA family protein
MNKEGVMKILIGVDASPCSDSALEFVRGLPLPASTRAIIVSAVQVVIPAYSEVYVAGGDAVDQLVEAETKAHAEVVAKAETKLRGTGLQLETRVLTGDPRDVLVKAAQDERADLLVVGSHGRTGIAKFVLGSVAAHVVTHAPCSVLVVKAKP